MSHTLDAQILAYAERTGIPEEDVLRIAVEEAFLRRAALVDGPFALKGSYVLRQHLREGWRRIPRDLDWVGLQALDAQALTRWATAVTEVQLDDGIRFRSFTENAFWRSIDYAMSEDFPTVNTDLLAWVADRPCEIMEMDVSFGLRLDPPPRPLDYQPVFGERFKLPAACALELQVAWKLHQCLVRPRFKDIFDLGLLLRDNAQVDPAIVWSTLADECARDAVPLQRFNWLLDGRLARHPAWQRSTSSNCTVEQSYTAWRDAPDTLGEPCAIEPALANIYQDGSFMPTTFQGVLDAFAAQLARAGFSRVDEPFPQVDEPPAPPSAKPWWKIW